MHTKTVEVYKDGELVAVESMEVSEEEVAHDRLLAVLDGALETNREFLAGNGERADQLRALTEQVDALIRLRLHRLVDSE